MDLDVAKPTPAAQLTRELRLEIGDLRKEIDRLHGLIEKSRRSTAAARQRADTERRLRMKAEGRLAKIRKAVLQ